MNELWRLLRQPRLATELILAAAVVAGFAILGLAYLRTSETEQVAFQVPYLVSGAATGLAMIGAGLALLRVHRDRIEGAEEIEDIVELRRLLRDRQGSRSVDDHR